MRCCRCVRNGWSGSHLPPPTAAAAAAAAAATAAACFNVVLLPKDGL